MHTNRLHLPAGFTLIEIMVVLVILGLLAGIIAPQFISRSDQAHTDKVVTDLGTIADALSLYRLDNNMLPTTEQGLLSLVEKPELAPVPRNWKSDGYLRRLPKDPWQKPYLYLFPAEFSDREYDLFSLGADGARGGEDLNEDIFR